MHETDIEEFHMSDLADSQIQMAEWPRAGYVPKHEGAPPPFLLHGQDGQSHRFLPTELSASSMAKFFYLIVKLTTN
jgi:hypothetical protein